MSSSVVLLFLLLIFFQVVVVVHSQRHPVRQWVRLGRRCRSDSDCSDSIAFSRCQRGACTCLPLHVPLNVTACTPGVLLGFPCVLHEQCQARVSHSQCSDDGVCICQPHFTSHFRDTCLSGSGLGEFCVSDAQCRLVHKLSHCRLAFHKGHGECDCLPGFHSHNNRTCRPTLGIGCLNDATCRSVTPHSVCTRMDAYTAICTCAPGHALARNGRRCVPTRKGLPELPVSLGKPCYSSEQCQARDPYSYCLEGTCSCVRDSQRCNRHNTGCFNDTFQCRNGQCISWYFVCNGRKNCDDGSDEDECIPHNCPQEAFQCSDGTCIPRSKVCNGRSDCHDLSDEEHCFDQCDAKAFRCGDGACLPQYSFCNAIVSCRDGSDERNSVCVKGKSCPADQFRCSNGRCRSTAILCSGRNGCGDFSDERNCNVCYCEKPE